MIHLVFCLLAAGRKKKMSDTTCHRSGDRSTNPIQRWLQFAPDREWGRREHTRRKEGLQSC